MSGLFGNLHEDAFLVFSRQNKRLYAQVILAIYREFFGTFHIRLAPTRAEVCDFVAGFLVKNPELWVDEEDLETIPDRVVQRGRKRRRKRLDAQARDPVAMRADHIYARLVACGWIEEAEVHFSTVAEMAPAAQALAERFHELDQGLEQYLGGVVIEIRNALQALEARPEENALGLKQAVDSAISFIRRLRGIHASLRGIERELQESTDVKGRLKTLLENFVGRILIQDFKNLLTMNHPYRFKSEIVALANKLALDRTVISQAALGYFANRVSETLEEAERRVAADLDLIQEAFDNIDTAFNRINDFRQLLETRLRNTIRYMDRVNDRVSAKLAMAIEAVGKAEYARAKSKMEPVDYVVQLTIEPSRLHPGNDVDRRGSFSVPPSPRTAVERRALAVVEKDPAIIELRRLGQQWSLMSNPSLPAVMDWLDKKVRPGETIDATLLQINDVPEFFAFMKLRGELLSMGAYQDFRFEILPDRREDDWIDTNNFRITRKEKGAA